MSVKRALISVSDKDGIVEFAKGLKDLGVEIISTGGTAKTLREAGIEVTDVSSVTGFPEALGGRLKTLHPMIHGGILARRSKKEHLREMETLGMAPIDIVVVNLYPFEKTIAKKGVSLEEAVENIDIGGPTMVRAAAKNYEDVAVIVDHRDYRRVLEELGTGSISAQTRFRLAQKAFTHTALYDGVISNYLLSLNGERYPPVLSLQFERVQKLRYGENPHQKAAFYRNRWDPNTAIASGEQLQGKELSYNNILDLDSAWALACTLSDPAAVIVKHTNPCGVGLSQTGLKDAFVKARECDPVSAFGGVMGFNRPVDGETAAAIGEGFVEAIAAPDYDASARALFEKKKNLRLLKIAPHIPSPEKEGWGGHEWEMRAVRGGILVQERDTLIEDVRTARVVTKRPPTQEEYAAMDFAMRVGKFVKSNAVVFAREDRLAAVGAGQMSRVDSVRIAVMKARIPLKGTVVASDAFFPFRDGVDECAGAGASAIVQPGGSVRDEEAVAAADEHGMAMVFTGIRHFRH